MRKKLTIIAHLAHYKQGEKFYSYEPYVREIELWSDIFECIEIYTDLRKNQDPNVPVKELPGNCNVKKIRMQAGPGFINNFKRILQLPFAIIKIYSIMLSAELLHIRSTGVTSTIANYLNTFLNKKTIVKWATIFEEIPPMTKIQRFELKLLKNPPSNTKVLIYGNGNHPNHVSFFPALMSEIELNRLTERIEPRDWSQKIRIICVGRLFRFKNFDTVIEGLTVFKRNYPNHNWELVLIGDGEEKSKIENLIKFGNLENEVKLMGSLPFSEVLEWYSKSHIAIMPGKYEGWPKIVNEAWATGCIPFVVNYGNATYPFNFAPNSGFSYEPNTQSFAENLNSLFNLSHTDKKMVFENGKVANKRMTLDCFKAEIQRIIEDIS